MIRRFQGVHSKFGFGATWRLLLLAGGMIVFSATGVLAFRSYREVIVNVGSLAVGYLLRDRISSYIVRHPTILNYLLVAYLLLIGYCWYSDWPQSIELAIINAATAIVFNVQFWTWSDPAVQRLEDIPIKWR